jgi:hypothetical protein
MILWAIHHRNSCRHLRLRLNNLLAGVILRQTDTVYSRIETSV